MVFARFRKRARATTDPIERILLDQLVLTNLKVAEMHAKASVAKHTDQAQVFLGAAARLLGSICQLTSTLAEYRSSRRPGQFPLEFQNLKTAKIKRTKKGRQNGK
jgi:hypothetical protein